LNIRDCLTIGLKLLGVYFIVYGLSMAAMTLLAFGIQTLEPMFNRDGLPYYVDGPVVKLMSAAQPIAFLVLGYLLARRTEWCLKLVGYPPGGASPGVDSDPPSTRPTGLD
jgi:hypothetical protein